LDDRYCATYALRTPRGAATSRRHLPPTSTPHQSRVRLPLIPPLPSVGFCCLPSQRRSLAPATAASVHGGDQGPVFDALLAREPEDLWGPCRRCEMVPFLPSPFFLISSRFLRLSFLVAAAGPGFDSRVRRRGNNQIDLFRGDLCSQGWGYWGFYLHGRSSLPMLI
jgi:hypothetical protein